MQVQKTNIKGLLIIKPEIFRDDRGSFVETYHKKIMEAHDIHVDFVQDNQSISHEGVVRGLHLQVPPFAQGKLIRVANGSALDIAVDMRVDSPTYGEYVSVLLTAQTGTMFWIPEGFAHGFAAMEDNTILVYKVTSYYHKTSEVTICWNDPTLNIDWQITNPILSPKDKFSLPFADFISPFRMKTGLPFNRRPSTNTDSL
jgi:dTDP-4-dehydrorhamnose 3,5-epimerase